jgi:prepilin-type N-terminal cleavage/methylation domain-containing protein
MVNNAGYTLIELLVVMGIVGMLAVIAIPSYSNYTGIQSVSQTAEDVKNEVRFSLNKSYSGLNDSWYGIAFSSVEGDNLASPNNINSDEFSNFEINDHVQCPLTLENLNTFPCNDSSVRTSTVKKYKQNVVLDKIIRINDQGVEVDSVPFAEIRFNRSPDANQVAFSFPTGNLPNIQRIELVFKNRQSQQSLVVDGGNICNIGEIVEIGKCGGNQTGGPRPGRVFRVENN